MVFEPEDRSPGLGCVRESPICGRRGRTGRIGEFTSSRFAKCLSSLSTDNEDKTCVISPCRANCYIMIGLNGSCNAMLPTAMHAAYRTLTDDWRQALQRSVVRSRGTSNNASSVLRMVGSGLKLLNVVLGAAAGSSTSANFGGNNDTTYVQNDSSGTSGFWQPIQSGAQDPIQ